MQTELGLNLPNNGQRNRNFLLLLRLSLLSFGNLVEKTLRKE